MSLHFVRQLPQDAHGSNAESIKGDRKLKKWLCHSRKHFAVFAFVLPSFLHNDFHRKSWLSCKMRIWSWLV